MARKRSVFGTALLPGFLAILLAASVLAAGPTEQMLYRFQGGSDGNTPLASMIADQAGNLYGTTSLGGGSSSCPGGCGTVFELTPPAESAGVWTETVLYRFQGGDDGAYPILAPLVADQAGNLYGTTASGGTGNCAPQGSVGCGTVFELVRPLTAGGAWNEVVLYSFQGVPSGRGIGDLAGPNGLAFGKSGSLYGLAYSGGHCQTDETGTYCYGGAYELTKPSAAGDAWTENVIHIFHGPTGGPAGPVFDKSGNLYGTVVWGKYGFGEVFRLEAPKAAGAAWTKVSVHDFQGPDGAFPEPGLAFDSRGDIFGATLGSPGYGSPYGNVYELNPLPDGTLSESVVYDFMPYTNGNTPNGGPILRGDDHIYGTASAGGESGAGVVFELTPPATAGGAWNYDVLYNFTGGAGGAPEFGLTFGLGGALYGTTPQGGNMTCGNTGYGDGCGTIFQVVP
jgi:uncharacterized repeat protein (TIGR03803 family)